MRLSRLWRHSIEAGKIFTTEEDRILSKKIFRNSAWRYPGFVIFAVFMFGLILMSFKAMGLNVSQLADDSMRLSTLVALALLLFLVASFRDRILSNKRVISTVKRLLWFLTADKKSDEGAAIQNPHQEVGEHSSQFVPRPGLIMIFKAIVSVTIGLQLFYPVIHKVQVDVFQQQSQASSHISQSLFFDQTEGALWTIALFSIVLVVYFIEYAWITRPFITSRDDRALDPAVTRPHWDDAWPGRWSRNSVWGEIRKRIKTRLANSGEGTWRFKGIWDDIWKWLKTSDANSNEGRKSYAFGGVRRHARALERLTLPYLNYLAWMPTLIVRVNLGFDSLDHRGVIQAMMVGLREEYYRCFLAWNSTLAMLRSFILLVLLLWLVNLTGSSWFGFPEIIRTPQEETPSASGQERYCQALRTHTPRPNEDSARAVFLLCETSETVANIVLPTLYYEILPIPLRHNLNEEEQVENGGEGDSHLWSVSVLFHENRGLYSKKSATVRELTNPKTLSFRVYHALLFAVFFVIWRWLVGLVPFLPYKENLRRIDDLLDSLTARTVVTRKRERWKPAQWIHSLFTDDETRQVDRDIVDPRNVELAFLNILEDMQRRHFDLPLDLGRRLSVPTPEFVFIFDELDKIGSRRAVPDSRPGPNDEQVISLDAERRRAVELSHLFANMKRIIASAPARFIFVGGRLIHDEWLADHTRRQPFFTSIFNAEFYIPSLLVDHSQLWNKPREDGNEGQGGGPESAEAKPSSETGSGWEMRGRAHLHTRMEQFVWLQHHQAQARYLHWAIRRRGPFIGVTGEENQPPGFTQERYLPEDAEEKLKKLLIRATHEQDGDIDQDWQSAMRDSFIAFLSYRSRGNPKRLKELLSSFIHPIGRVITEPHYRTKNFSCHDVLYLGNTELIRIQLIESVYRHIARRFESAVKHRDDKIAISVFYLTDFLLKFHRRAFAWSNLDRIDELVHIHRAPDTRRILEAIVEHCSERFLHRVLNGMYAFRFRSDFAKEIEYLSRLSSAEMAAFNFTLDESQTLKSAYNVELKSSDRANPDIIAALGELDEYDQDYEAARQHYRHASAIADQQLEHVVGKELSVTQEGDEEPTRANDTGKDEKERKEAPPKVPVLKAIMSGDLIGVSNAKYYVSWGIIRLRLMLQIAMTYELARDLERANAQYRQARMLARSLSKSYLGEWHGLDDKRPHETSPLGDEKLLHMLKHFMILYQPIFANAWAALKLPSGIDTSGAIVERALLEIRRSIPFLKDPEILDRLGPPPEDSYPLFAHLPNLLGGGHRPSQEAARIEHSVFALVGAELHNKAGNIYFFQGRQIIKEADSELGEERSPLGYTFRAHYHYAVCLHEIRRYICYRRVTSHHKFSAEFMGGEGMDVGSPIRKGQWPNFVYLAASNGLNNMAEATLARVSFYGLLSDLQKPGQVFDSVCNTKWQKGFTEACIDWFELLDHETRGEETICVKRYDAEETHGGRFFSVGKANAWFGEWADKADPSDNYPHFVKFWGPDDDLKRVIMSLNLKRVGADLMLRGGYPEDSGREHLQIAQTAVNYLWWISLHDWCEGNEIKSSLSWDEALRKERYQDFIGYLVHVGVRAIEEADARFMKSCDQRFSDGRPIDNSYLIGDVVPAAALTTACALGLVNPHLTRRSELNWINERKKLSKILNKWTNDPKYRVDAAGHVKWQPTLIDCLVQSLKRHRYPVLNQLNALKVLIDSSIIFLPESPHETRVEDWARELEATIDRFGAPLHFTPLQAGMTFALVALWLKRKDPRNRSFDDIALRYLYRSHEMHTMGRAFYETISGMYYLYDDFNDRQVHYNHAMQMAGSELAYTLCEKLRSRP